MTETNGLRNILNTAGTVHSIAESPDRADFETEELYEVAYEAWYWRTVSWGSSSMPTESSES